VILFDFTEDEEEDDTDVKAANSYNPKSNGSYCLTLPGRKLYLKPLLAMKNFCKYGNKCDAVEAFYYLEKEGFGKVLEVTTSKGSAVVRV